MTRTERGRAVIWFSGTLVCGACGSGSMVICAGGGKRGYVKYGCHSHKHNGMCGNKLMIRQDRLEEQLLGAIGQQILNPSTLETVIKRCENELRKRLIDMERQRATTSAASLEKDLDDRERREAILIDAIERGGDIPSLTERLRGLGSEIERIQEAPSTRTALSNSKKR